MEIIAKTAQGFILTATANEVDEILSAIMGKKPEKVEIGQKIPAIDYASTIRKISSLGQLYDWKQLLAKVDDFNKVVENLKIAVESAANLKE